MLSPTKAQKEEWKIKGKALKFKAEREKVKAEKPSKKEEVVRKLRRKETARL